MKQKEAKELHKKILKEDLKIRKESSAFENMIWKLGRHIINNGLIDYDCRLGIGYYVPLIIDLYITYNYGPSVANRMSKHNPIVKHRRRFKKHKYA